MFWSVLLYGRDRCPLSSLLQALQAFLRYSPASYSARWSSTFLTKSLRVSSTDKSRYTFFVSIFFCFLNQLMFLFWLLVRLCPSFCCSLTSLKHAHLLSLPWAPVLRYEKIFSPCIAPFQSSVPLTGMWYVVQPPYRMKWEITLLVAWQYWGLPSLWTLWWSAWWLEWEPCQVHAAI